MTEPSMDTQSDDQNGGNAPEPPPDHSGIDFDTIFNNREPGGEKRHR